MFPESLTKIWKIWKFEKFEKFGNLKTISLCITLKIETPPFSLRNPIWMENEKWVLSSLDPRGGFSYLILPPGPACFRPTGPLEFRSGTVCHMLRLVSYQSSFNPTNFAGHECRNRPWGTLDSHQNHPTVLGVWWLPKVEFHSVRHEFPGQLQSLA